MPWGGSPVENGSDVVRPCRTVGRLTGGIASKGVHPVAAVRLLRRTRRRPRPWAVMSFRSVAFACSLFSLSGRTPRCRRHGFERNEHGRGAHRPLRFPRQPPPLPLRTVPPSSEQTNFASVVGAPFPDRGPIAAPFVPRRLVRRRSRGDQRTGLALGGALFTASPYVALGCASGFAEFSRRRSGPSSSRPPSWFCGRAIFTRARRRRSPSKRAIGRLVRRERRSDCGTELRSDAAWPRSRPAAGSILDHSAELKLVPFGAYRWTAFQRKTGRGDVCGTRARRRGPWAATQRERRCDVASAERCRALALQSKEAADASARPLLGFPPSHFISYFEGHFAITCLASNRRRPRRALPLNRDTHVHTGHVAEGIGHHASAGSAPALSVLFP